VAYKRLLHRVGLERTSSFIVEGRFMDDFPGYLVYVRKKDGPILKEVFVYETDANGKMVRRIHADHGEISSNLSSNQVLVQLYDVQVLDLINWSSGHIDEIPQRFTFANQPPDQAGPKVSLSDMTFDQLCAKLRELKRLSLEGKPLTNSPPDQLREQKRQLESLKADLTMPVRVQIHRQVAFSFASIGFTLIGIPLGVRAHRRETSIGMAMAIILVLVYYSFIIVGQALETRPELAPHLILWLPNFIFQAAGAVLLWRANRGI
jgi:lipopolysaccharide export system permease protein